MARIGGDGAEGISNRAEQEAVHDGFVMKGDGRDRCGHGEDQVNDVRSTLPMCSTCGRGYERHPGDHDAEHPYVPVLRAG